MLKGQRRRDAAAVEEESEEERRTKGIQRRGTGENRVYFPPSIVCTSPSLSLSLSLPVHSTKLHIYILKSVAAWSMYVDSTQWPIWYGIATGFHVFLSTNDHTRETTYIFFSLILSFFLIFRWTRCRTKFTRGCRRNIYCCECYTVVGYIFVSKKKTISKISQIAIIKLEPRNWSSNVKQSRSCDSFPDFVNYIFIRLTVSSDFSSDNFNSIFYKLK